MSNQSRKISVAGNGNKCFGYSNWLNPTKMVKRIEDADLLLGLGGADISPYFYNQPNLYSHCSPMTDREEFQDYKKAIRLGKKIIGTCRGCQWGSVLAGGALFQHVSHPGLHLVKTFDGDRIIMNSLHHQMCDLSNLKNEEDYFLLGWAEGISSQHLNGFGDNVECLKEPEAVYFPKINFLGFQNHYEMMYRNAIHEKSVIWAQKIVEHFMNGTIEDLYGKYKIKTPDNKVVA